MDNLIDFVTSAGLEVPIIAIAIVILTGLIKMPIKRIANHAHYPKRITRFIILLPVVIGFGLTALFMFIDSGAVHFTDGFYNRWLSAVSLSLAIYAVWEKFVPPEKKILSEVEIKANQEFIEELKEMLIKNPTAKETQSNDDSVGQTEEPIENMKVSAHRKIILTNNKKN